MSYSPTPWETGDVIGAEKLNNSCLFVINAVDVANQDNPTTTPTLDKTYNEIKAAIDAGMTPVIYYKEDTPIGEGTMTVPFLYKISSGIQDEGDFLSFSQTRVSFGTTCADMIITEVQISKRGIGSTYKDKKLAYYSGS